MKIAFIGHSYHRTTRSTVFFIDELRRRGEVELLWDESWLGKPGLDPARLRDGGFDAVVVFQVERIAPALARAGMNVTFIPMYDGCHFRPDGYWTSLGELKVLSFSSTLHERLQKLRVRSRFVQFFPDPAGLPAPAAGGEPKGYFWQRTDDITWATIRPLLGDAPFHGFTLHRAVDPGAGPFVAPSAEDVRRFGIRTTEWFPDRAAATADLASHNVYFAPRLREGIGQSFLEAMAMGFLVVAPDHPTMNEYLVSGVNGLLYDPARPRPLDFTRRLEMGARARRTVELGYAKWRRCVEAVMDYVAAPPAESPVLARWDALDPWAMDTARETPLARRAPAPVAPIDARLEGGCRSREAGRAASPRVTIAVVTRNAAGTLPKTLESALRLDFASREIVVIDGASTDGTVEILREHDGDIDYWRSAPDGGPFEAMNAAALAARGEYVIFMNAGDTFQATDSLTRALDGAPATADVIFGHHVYRHVDGHEELHRAADFAETWHRLRAGDVGWRWQCAVPGHQATLTRTELLRRFPYRTDLRIAADHDALYRYARSGARFHHCGAVLATYVGGGLSWQNQERCFEEWRRLALEYTERQDEVRRVFLGMAADHRRQLLSGLSTWKLLRLSASEAIARSMLRKRLRARVKEGLRATFRRRRRIVIEFGTPELGGVQYVHGLSVAEGWGRWTDGQRAVIELAEPVSRPVRVRLHIQQAFGPNVGRPLVVRLDGSGEFQHVLGEGAQALTFRVPRSTSKPLSRIELGIPAPTSPVDLAAGGDARRLGVALSRLEIVGNR
jgi:glycosyltransferase involved in cell wall biosynthesis